MYDQWVADGSWGTDLIFHFEDCVLDIERRELRRSGVARLIEPQVFDLLEYLIRSREHVVSRDEIFAAVWHGRIVSDSVLSTRINAVRRAIGDSGAEQRLIRTYRRKGIRFVGVVLEGQNSAAAIEVSPKRITAAFSASSRPSIAVISFRSMSRELEHQWLADGITEEVILGLSHLRWLSVTHCNSIIPECSVDIRRIVREHGSQYVLEGSVRAAPNCIRITAKLIDSLTGYKIWTEQYDRDVVRTFADEDDIAKRIVLATASQLYSTDHMRAPTASYHTRRR